ncbi:MAG TPA: CcoQ/FixQ family Cbb3-type cytochrome c oxidase assembly chaperone [Bacteroidia bacterium]|nr:CcoQ/FixQ family Cbb3-type cytochrome c oxidase assembly chaperone [Bacteroidia bacterium]
MKFINYLESIAGIAIYPLISLFIFTIFFLLLTMYAIKADKKHISELKNIPLDNEQN